MLEEPGDETGNRQRLTPPRDAVRWGCSSSISNRAEIPWHGIGCVKVDMVSQKATIATQPRANHAFRNAATVPDGQMMLPSPHGEQQSNFWAESCRCLEEIQALPRPAGGLVYTPD